MKKSSLAGTANGSERKTPVRLSPAGREDRNSAALSPSAEARACRDQGFAVSFIPSTGLLYQPAELSLAGASACPASALPQLRTLSLNAPPRCAVPSCTDLKN